MASLLAPHLLLFHYPMHQPMSGDPPTSICLAATLPTLLRPRLTRPQGMDQHLQLRTFPAHPAVAETGNLPSRPQRHERNENVGCATAMQDIPALPCAAERMGRHARSLDGDIGDYGPADEQWARRYIGKFPFPGQFYSSSPPPPPSLLGKIQYANMFFSPTLQEEAVPESLKNIVLVMASGGYLVPPTSPTGEKQDQTPRQQKLWSETWIRLNRFLPDLMPELFPSPPPGTAAAAPAPATTTAGDETAVPAQVQKDGDPVEEMETAMKDLAVEEGSPSSSNTPRTDAPAAGSADAADA